MFKVAEFGTDFDSSFSFEGGDLTLVSDKENIIQSIANRINTNNGFFDLYYNEYGGVLQNFLGWKATEKTSEFIKIELTNILKQDPRLIDFELELNYLGNGKIRIQMLLNYNEDSDLSLSMVLSENGVTIEEEDNIGEE